MEKTIEPHGIVTWKSLEQWADALAPFGVKITGEAHGSDPTLVRSLTISRHTALAPGDVVQLPSGGPPMTLSGDVVAGKSMTCAWFDGGELRRDSFPVAALRRMEAPTAPSPQTSEPDAWQTDQSIGAYAATREDFMESCPEGFEPISPWFPFAALANRDPDAESDCREIYVWRRPLRKVSP